MLTVNVGFPRRTGAGLLTIVATADVGVPPALVADVNWTVKVLLFSGTVSPMIVTGMDCDVTPGEKVRVPEAAR